MRRGLMLALLLWVCAACAATGSISTPAAPAAASAGPAGADAAPAANASPSWELRRAQFDFWFSYQAVDGADPDKNSDLAWAAGVAACSSRAARGTIEDAKARVRQLGWSVGGTTAVVAAALRAQCPQWDEVPPHETVFDHSVAAAQGALRRELPWADPGPERFATGWFAKLTCAHLEHGNARTLEPLLHSHRVGGANQYARGAAFIQAFGTDAPLLRRGTALVVRQVCYWRLDSLRSQWGEP